MKQRHQRVAMGFGKDCKDRLGCGKSMAWTFPSPGAFDPYGVLEGLLEQSLTFASKSDSAAKRH